MAHSQSVSAVLKTQVGSDCQAQWPRGNNRLTCAGLWAPGSDRKRGLLPSGIGPRAPAGPSASLGKGGESSVSIDGWVGGDEQAEVAEATRGARRKGTARKGLGRQTAHPGEAGGPCLRRPGGTTRALYTRRPCQRTAAPCCPKTCAKVAFPPQR